MGYLFAIASADPLDFRDITRGDYWDYRLIDGGRIQGDPYVRLTDLAARLAPTGHYDYDIAPYYVDHHYDYPRFVCYDCHAYASYRDWDPYRSSCTRYRVVIRDDPRYYPYRYGGRNVIADRLAHPGPRYVFRDADPRRPAVTHGASSSGAGSEDDPGRTSDDIGGRGSVPAPGSRRCVRREADVAPELSPVRPLLDERRRVERRREAQPQGSAPGQRQLARRARRPAPVDLRAPEHGRARAAPPAPLSERTPLYSAGVRSPASSTRTVPICVVSSSPASSS